MIQTFFKEQMNRTFEVNQKEYNLIELGWSFGYNNRKTALGVCKMRTKRIELSNYFIGTATTAELMDTVLHEIAHAIDVEMRGTSDHSYRWQIVAVAVGAEPTRCKEVDLSSKADESKYTLTCPNCKKSHPSHKRRKRIPACGECCNKYAGGRFSQKYVFDVKQNY